MSNAKPMSEIRRSHGYFRARDQRAFTPRQWRRWRHKWNRAHKSPFGHWVGSKGRPTPRRPRRG